ncbi:MAG TPA: protein kinase [Candidatus Angelobacter sp.]|nr:protein kinase [Candidatus Angelobacter sp.]
MMTPERWSRIKEIFSAVLDRSAEDRQLAILEACQGDTELQAELQQLLAQHDEMGQFLEGDSPVSAAGLLNPNDILAGRYEIIALLGSGGMGEVYEVEDKELGGRIALKVVHPQMSFDQAVLERFRREVLLARQVTHPNVCRVFDIGYHKQQGREIIFLTMELVRGETLAARIKRDGRLESREALTIATQLCQALGAAHQAGVLHRDFKCGNVILIGSGDAVRAVVTDFGIARWTRSTQDSAGMVTTQGAIFGTPAYMSPEQLQGKELTIASDIYSLGLVLYEMVTGARPFQGESSWTEALKRLTDDPMAPDKIFAKLGRNWNTAILKCLERDPARRFLSAAEVIASLRREKSPLSIRRRLLPASAALFLLAASMAFVLSLRIFAPSLPVAKHIAVLPFKSTGGDPTSQATADGLAESLSGNLSRLQISEKSMWVVPWKAVRERPASDDRHLASALGVNLILTGELEKQGDNLHLHVELKDAATLRDLRSTTIEIPEAQIVTLEDSLLEKAASMLQLPLPDGTIHHLPVDATTEPGAYAFYEQGKGYLLRFTPDDVEKAIVLLQRAIDKDHRFSLAYASLARAYSWKYQTTKDTTWHDKARQACTQALALDDKLAYGHLALGMIQKDAGDVAGAIQQFQQALLLDPTSSETQNQLSRAYDQAGRLLEAENLLKDAIRRNPASWTNYNDLGYFYFLHAQYRQAEPLFHSATQLAPDNPVAFRNLGAIYIVLGKYKDAESILTRAIAIRPDAEGFSNLGTALFYQNRYKDSASMFQQATRLSPHDDRLWRNLGDAYMLAGAQSEASQAYETAIKTLEKVLALSPRDGLLLENLSLYHAKLAHKEKALSILARATRLSLKTPEFVFTSALVYELCGMRARALEALRVALQAGYSRSEIASAPELVHLREDARYVSMLGPG